MSPGQRLGIGMVLASLCVAGVLAWLGQAVHEGGEANTVVAGGAEPSEARRSAGGSREAVGDRADDGAGDGIGDAEAAARAERIERLREAVRRERAALNEDRAARQELAAALERLRDELERSRAEVAELEQEVSAAADPAENASETGQ